MCKARRVNDQYHCHACGFQWDVDDEDRPMCKPGNGVRGVMLAVALGVSGVASAELNCDASQVADLTTVTLGYAEACNVTLDRYGVDLGARSAECQLTRVASEQQFAAVLELRDTGCTSYYAGPSRKQLARLVELGNKFEMMGR